MEQSELLARLIDSRDDTDVGSYQLFVYNFAKANQTDGIDTLIGREGIDIIDGGPGEDYALRLEPLAAGTSLEGSTFTRRALFTNPGSSSWTAIVEYGDDPGTADIVNNSGFTPESGLSLSHGYLNNGNYTINVLLRNDDGVQVSRSFIVSVENVAPFFEAGPNASLPAASLGVFSRLGIVITDPGADVWSGTVNYGDSATNSPLSIKQTTKQFSLNHTYMVQGTFTVNVVVSDGDQTYADSFEVTVNLNLPPLAVNDSATAIEAGAVTEDAVVTHATGTLTVIDPDAGQTVFQTSAPASLIGTFGNFAFNATTGVWTYTLDNSLVATDALVAGQIVTESLNVLSNDGTANRTIVITITGAGAGSGKSIYVLNSSAGGSLALSGNATITIQGPVYVNSNSSTAATVSGNARIAASQVRIVGGAQVTGNSNISPTPVTGVPATPDPLALLAAPTGSPATNALACSGNSIMTVTAGSYTSINASGNCKLTFSPGIYIVAGDGFSVSGNANVTGNGVLFYNAGSNFPNPGGNFGSIFFSGTGQFHFNPSTTGAYSGVTFFQARDNTAQVTLSGNSIEMKGTFYAPKAQMIMSGSGQLQMSLIVDRFHLSGNASSALIVNSSTEISGLSVVSASNQTLKTGIFRVAIEDDSMLASPEQLARIRDAFAAINTHSDASTVSSNQFDYQTIVMHELGHAFGLEHSSDVLSVMFQSLEPGMAKRRFAEFDLELLKQVHEMDQTEPHFDALRATKVPVRSSKEQVTIDSVFRTLSTDEYDIVVGNNRRKRRWHCGSSPINI